MRRNCGFLFILSLAIHAPAFGALQWEASTIEKTVAIGQDRIEISFRFSNIGDRQVTVREVKPSCGCTTASLEKKTYAPHEKGALTLFIDTKALVGAQEKTVLVLSDDDSKPTTLTVRLTVPVWAEINPRLLWWEIGEKNVLKEADILLKTEGRLKIASPIETPGFEVELKREPGEAQAHLRVKPQSTGEPRQAVITLEMVTPSGTSRNYLIHAQVR